MGEMKMDDHPDIVKGPGGQYHYSTTPEGGEHIKNVLAEEHKQYIEQKQGAEKANQRERFDKLEVGASIAIKNESDELVYVQVVEKNPNTMTVTWTKDLTSSSGYGGEISMDKVLDFVNPVAK